jgi:tetratricopeptide (TPR) repeat protein
MWKSGGTGYKINAVFLSFVLLIGLWNISIFYIPALLITGVAGFAVIRNNRQTIPVFVITLSFLLLLLYETVNFSISTYQPSSILFLRDFLIILCCTFLIDKLLRNKKYRIYFVVFISIMAGLLALFNIPIFFFRYYESTIYGFEDFSQFRFLYRPLGLLSNEWVTILLCLMPFPLIGVWFFRDKKWIRYGFWLIAGLLLFNILISFSRAGILAFLLFAGLLNVFLYVKRIVTLKKLFLFDGILIVSLAVFSLCFSGSIQSSIRQTNSHQRSAEGRMKQWEQISGVIEHTPFLGIGSKNYALQGRTSQQFDLENSFTGRVNNTYIQLLMEKGWVGLLLWLCVIGIIVLDLFRKIGKGKKRIDRAVNCIILSAILAVLFREIFFSSLLYNSGLLLFFFILLIFNRNETERRIAIRKPALIGLAVLFASGAVYLYFKKPENALTYAEKGLEYERSIEFQLSCNLLNEYPDALTKTKQDTLAQAIQYYQKACRLNPSDAMFQHNLGWLYWMNRQPDLALFHISQAVESEPNIAVYHISKGLMVEWRNPEEAFEAYKQAILLSPDIIDSPFFKDLKDRNWIKTGELLKNTSNKLLKMLSVRYSSIIEAKSGKLLLSLGETERAYEALSHVVKIHPNLSRPWYYLGFIEQGKGNFDTMQTFYKKSLFLSPFDHLPLSAFAFHYKEIENESKSKSYNKAAEKAWKNKLSIHSSQCKRMYYTDTEKDDVIPQGFLDYITPIFQTQAHDTD